MWAIELKDDETVSRGRSEGRRMGEQGEMKCGKQRRMQTIQGQGQGRVCRNLAHSVQVVVIRGDSLRNKGERERFVGEWEGETPSGCRIDIYLHGSAGTNEQLDLCPEEVRVWPN